MARPVTRDQRRGEILSAAIRLLKTHDGGELSIPDIARDLDVTPNAIRYYFRDVDQVLEEITAEAYDRFVSHRQSAVQALHDPRDQLATMIAAGLPSGPDDVEWRVSYRLVMAGKITAARGELIGSVFQRQAEIYQAVLEDGEREDCFVLASSAVDVARTLMLMEDMLGYHVVALDPGFDRPEAIRLMCAYAQTATATTLPQIT